MKYLLYLLWGGFTACLWWLAFSITYENPNNKGLTIFGAVVASLAGLVATISEAHFENKL